MEAIQTPRPDHQRRITDPRWDFEECLELSTPRLDYEPELSRSLSSLSGTTSPSSFDADLSDYMPRSSDPPVRRKDFGPYPSLPAGYEETPEMSTTSFITASQGSYMSSESTDASRPSSPTSAAYPFTATHSPTLFVELDRKNRQSKASATNRRPPTAKSAVLDSPILPHTPTLPFPVFRQSVSLASHLYHNRAGPKIPPRISSLKYFLSQQRDRKNPNRFTDTTITPDRTNQGHERESRPGNAIHAPTPDFIHISIPVEMDLENDEDEEEVVRPSWSEYDVLNTPHGTPTAKRIQVFGVVGLPENW